MHFTPFFRNALSAFSLLLVYSSGYSEAPPAPPPTQAQSATVPDHEKELLSATRQLTFSGRRAGEGYFSADGAKLIFQSEREEGNPFYQIYLLDLASGQTTRVSPGSGKTSCAWIHPDGQHLLFASTHEDTESRAKQDAEFAERKSSKIRKYSWDFDEHFDIFQSDLAGKNLVNLTHTTGYDAEGSYSPDGKQIVFASNRQAYDHPLTEDEKKRLEIDKSYFMEIYLMDADGKNVRRLTNCPGYDGGPFFSADGKHICWRRFSEKGDTAEVWIMNADGSNQRQVTHLGAMSWAPYFHPSGEYLIFTTNRHGFDNFELYIADVEGKHEPIRVTGTPGFDGLPVFSPDGQKLCWTTNRTSDQTSQLFLAKWDHAKALELLGKNASFQTKNAPSNIGIQKAALETHVRYLASKELQGRLTGTEGERLATVYVADQFCKAGLEPAGDKNTFFNEFPFTSGVELGQKNLLASLVSSKETPITLENQWRPLSFSQVGDVPASEIVFAGYGIEEPEGAAEKGTQAYSSYFHLEVKDKWVMILRYHPEGAPTALRERLAHYSNLRQKALVARQHGAKGLIVVSGPNSKVRSQLVPLGFDAALAGSGIFAISVTDETANNLLAASGKTLKALQDQLDKGEPIAGFLLVDAKLSASIDIKAEKRTGHNVIARLRGTAPGAAQRPPLVIGAHLDHLGNKAGSNSLAKENETDLIHYGADDNASGVSGMIEIARSLAEEQKSGKLALPRDVIFCGWSGEELGLIGSANWVRQLAKQGGDEEAKLTGKLSAYLNMDMIGRLREKLILQGVGSSSVWGREIEQANVPAGLNIVTQSDAYLPTDATSFYLRGVPVLAAFTGSHEEYHTPRDKPDTLNFEGTAQVASLMKGIAESIALNTKEPDYKEMEKPKDSGRGTNRVYLGTVPDYAQGDIEGVKLSGVAKLGPAQKAGVQGGDVIVELNGKPLKNIYDYTYVMGDLKIGVETTIVVLRKGEKVTMKITPSTRE